MGVVNTSHEWVIKNEIPSIYQHNTHSLPYWAICYSCDVDIGTQVLNNGTEVIWLFKIAA